MASSIVPTMEEVELHVQENPESTHTQLFSFLALLSAYVPESYLLMSECHEFLGPPDPIHGGPPFEKRMLPFTALINISDDTPHTTSAEAEHRCSIDPETAQKVLVLLAKLSIANGDTNLRFTRSNIAKKLIRSNFSFQYIKDLLTKRQVRGKAKEKFSRLITNILRQENLYNAVSVLKTASDKFNKDPMYPQAISRLYYINGHYEQAWKWAWKAIGRAPHNSYVADTLGQVFKNRLMKAQRKDVIHIAEEAFTAFEQVEDKAEREDDVDNGMPVSLSKVFNNRGRFGFIQVAKLAFEKYPPSQKWRLKRNKKNKVADTFDFFEWYLTYSKPDETTFEPSYFWKDVAQCYQCYTGKSADESTSFAGLLDWLNEGLVMSKGSFSFSAQRSVSELEEVQQALKHSYEEQPQSVDVAERYILSNIILSNKAPDSPHITQMTKLREILIELWPTHLNRESPEFCLLVLLLFWPDVSENQENLYLEIYATFMEKAFERTIAKYLRGRYLLPLFYLGKGSGLSKWIHTSKLDVIMKNQGENQEDFEGEMLEIPEIQDMLLPVTVEPFYSPSTPQGFVCVGGYKIKATTEGKADVSIHSPGPSYLGVTIQGPVVFKLSPTDAQLTE